MKFRSYWLKLAAGIILVVLLFLFKVNFAEFGSQLQQSNPRWIIAAGLLHIIGLLLSAYRWQILLAVHDVKAPLVDLIQSYLIGGFFNNFLPTRVGGDVYRMVDSKKYSGSLLRPFAVIVVERLSGIYGLLLIGIAALSFYPRLSEIRGFAIALLALTIGGFLAIFLFYGSGTFANLLKKLVSKLPVKISTKAAGLLDAFWEFSGAKGVVLYAFFLGLLLQANVILYYFFIAQGIGMSLSFLEACIVMPILICIQLIPLTPNGIGVREFSYIYLLQPFGVSEAQAVAFSLWDYVLTFAYGIIGGILYLLKKERTSESLR
ncbi:MAG TPA: lysylphosphatidylglycerol synthase transmembrane domain-containing protein [Acidobacteriota bacterium]|nr:lysylphosphatidylglycerol synthase transmembrane domain-containing protein [Acidobacteriota bacterium]